MSFTRLKYDLCEQKIYNKQSSGPGSYSVNEPLTCAACFQVNPMIRMQKSGVSLHKNYDWRFYSGPVDVESELMNLTRAASNCNKYMPTCNTCNKKINGQHCSSEIPDKCRDCLRKNPGDENIVDFPNCYFPISVSPE